MTKKPPAPRHRSDSAVSRDIDFRGIVDNADDIVIVGEIDGAARIVYVNDAFTRLTGYSAAEALGRSPRMLQGAETSADTVREISAAIHGGKAIRRRILNYAKDGRKFWVEVSIVPLRAADRWTRMFASIERDVTADIRREQMLQVLASADPLTRLLTRRAGEEFLAREFARARRNALPLSLAILDIDNLKSVNDDCGHHTGDRMLVAFADVLRRSLRSYDCAARIGGDEFMVVLPQTDRRDALPVLRRVVEEVRDKTALAVAGRVVGVSCSGGLTSLGRRDRGAQSLILRADRALYLAKNGGRGRIVELGPESRAARGDGVRGAS